LEKMVVTMLMFMKVIITTVNEEDICN